MAGVRLATVNHDADEVVDDLFGAVAVLKQIGDVRLIRVLVDVHVLGEDLDRLGDLLSGRLRGGGRLVGRDRDRLVADSVDAVVRVRRDIESTRKLAVVVELERPIGLPVVVEALELNADVFGQPLDASPLDGGSLKDSDVVLVRIQ